MCYPVLKRWFDLVMAGLGLLLLLPLGLLIALIIKLSDGGPVFYNQRRIGQFGRPFPIRKFRSMVVNAEKLGLPVTPEGDPRITWMGRLLRKTKLDELPLLMNGLVGEMSLVGPRPEAWKYVDMFADDFTEILRVRPGITDPASIEFRDEGAILARSTDPERTYIEDILPQKIRLAKTYIAQQSCWGDFRLLVNTVGRLLSDRIQR